MEDSLAQIDSAEKGATTFRHYFAAYHVCCRTYGYGEIKQLLAEQLKLRWFASDGEKVKSSALLRRHLFRGWLTLQAMRQLPITEAPELAIGASMWLPIQAYYACHGVGLAALHCTGQTLPQESGMTHSGFLAAVSRSIAKNGYFMPPFDTSCLGDCSNNAEAFDHASVTPEEVRQLSTLRRPQTQRIAEIMVAKSLRTARADVLANRFEEHKKRARPKRERLHASEKEPIASRLHPTTCVDFLYRMRIRSNYNKADLYLFGQSPHEAAAYCAEVIWLADAICGQLANVIRHRIGSANYAKLREDFRSAPR